MRNFSYVKREEHNNLVSRKLVTEDNRLWNSIETFHDLCNTLHPTEGKIPIASGWDEPSYSSVLLEVNITVEKGITYLLLKGKSELDQRLILKISLDHMSLINQHQLIKDVICHERRVKTPLSQIKKFDTHSGYEKNHSTIMCLRRKYQSCCNCQCKTEWYIMTNYGRSQ
jgi:hypothetical protein